MVLLDGGNVVANAVTYRQLMILRQVNPNYICQMWPVVGPLLAKGLPDNCEYTIEQLKGMLATGERTLLVADDGEIKGACAVSLSRHPNKFVCWIMSLGGSGGVLFLAEKLEEWAKAQGCTDIKAETSGKLSNLFKERCGYDNSRVVISKKL